MTTSTNQNNSIQNPEDHTIIEITSNANSLIYNIVNLAIKNAPHIPRLTTLVLILFWRKMIQEDNKVFIK
jgi:hypothetical protein